MIELDADEKKREEELEGKEAEVLRLCFERPSSVDDIANVLTMNDVEVKELIDALKDRGLITEEDGKYRPTKEGDHYFS